jgi:Xaa-Pro aminopeptidase
MDDWLLLVTPQKARGFMQRMLVDQFKMIAPFCKAEETASPHRSLLTALKTEKIKHAAFDGKAETYTLGCFWRENGLRDVPGLTAKLRLVKDAREAELIAKSCRIAARAFKAILPRIKIGLTENQVRAELEYIMDVMGAKEPSFSTIIGSGPNSALPHHVTGERKIRNNEALLLDYGCKYKDYCSDISRTIFIGKPTEEFKKIYAIVDKSQKAGVKAVKAGVSTNAVDKVCRDIIAAEGYGSTFIHGTGHGLGLDIHEPPRLNTNPAQDMPLQPGMAVTVEPGIYLLGKFGVRIEDTVLVTKTGCEILTK